MADFNYVQAIFDRGNLSPDEDVAVMTMHIREAVQGSPDFLPVTDEGRQSFTTNFGTWWGNIRSMVSTYVTFRELRFYDVPAAPGENMGDPVAIKGFATPGTSTSSALPPQCAVSVTFKTSARLHWGRFYIPGLTVAHIDDKGRLNQTDATTIADQTHVLTRRDQTGGVLVVFSRSRWAHYDPQEIQVDDIIDVQRRRRFSSPHFRAVKSAG